MIEVRLCPSCWPKLSPLLGRAAPDERAFLRYVATRLSRCKTCRVHAPALRIAAEQSNPLGAVIETVWEWVGRL